MLNYIVGLVLGMVTGLLPGIHPNTVSAVASGALPMNGMELAIFLCLIYMVNSVTEFVPSIFLSAPSEATSLALLPGHRMLLEGKGLQALELAFRGAALGAVFFVLLLAPALAVLEPFLAFSAKFMFWILLIIVANAILREKNRLMALGIFAVAGILGIASGKLPMTNDQLLFVLLTGAFGIATILVSLRLVETVPKQKEGAYSSLGTVAVPSLAGTLGGFLVGTLPAVSPSQAVYLLSSVFSISGEGFLASLGAVASTSFLFSLVTLYASGKARNGTAVLIERAVTLDLPSLIALLIASILGLAAAVFLLKKLVRPLVAGLSKINYFSLNLLVLAFLLLLIDLWVGPLGLLVALTAAALGVFCQLSGVKRTNLMGMLLLPTMLFYLGL